MNELPNCVQFYKDVLEPAHKELEKELINIRKEQQMKDELKKLEIMQIVVIALSMLSLGISIGRLMAK